MLQEKEHQLLNVAGLRATNQRSLILNVIRHGEGHLDADEIYRRARDRGLRLSLSTVYRTLLTLKKLGLVEEVHFDEAHHHYELKPPVEHHHLACLGCGKIIEFSYPVTRYVKQRVAEAKHFDIVNAELRITGYCAECQRKGK